MSFWTWHSFTFLEAQGCTSLVAKYVSHWQAVPIPPQPANQSMRAFVSLYRTASCLLAVGDLLALFSSNRCRTDVANTMAGL